MKQVIRINIVQLHMIMISTIRTRSSVEVTETGKKKKKKRGNCENAQTALIVIRQLEGRFQTPCELGVLMTAMARRSLPGRNMTTMS